MNSLMLPWTTRGLKHDSWTYLISVSLEPRKTTPKERGSYLIYPEMPMKVALPLLVKLRGSVGQFIEYGCFELDGTLIPDPGLRIKRQGRNILYCMIRDLANLSRGLDRFNAGMTIGLVNDPVPASPEGNWAVLFSTECPNQAKMISALQPLIDVRSGQLTELPKLDPPAFQDWIVEQFNNRLLPPYLLISDIEQPYTGEIW